jgi:hypothetical protein
MHGAANSVGLLTTAALALCFGASAPTVNVSARAGAQPIYRLKLGPFVAPPTRTLGLVVTARINGGPPLRLLLDSGTQCIVLDRKAAVKSGCLGGADLDLVAAGASAPAVVKKLLAGTVDVGDLTLHDVPLLIGGRHLADGINGALPLSIFAGFLIRLDIPGKSLDLFPYPPEQAETTGALKALSSNHLLFVKGTVNDAYEGYFLLDTGASYTAISRNVARRLNMSEALAPHLPLGGGTENIDAPLVGDSVRLRVGTTEFATGPVVAVDLSTASQYHKVEMSGLIGYSVLRQSILTVNYRDGLIRIEPK